MAIKFEASGDVSQLLKENAEDAGLRDTGVHGQTIQDLAKNYAAAAEPLSRYRILLEAILSMCPGLTLTADELMRIR